MRAEAGSTGAGGRLTLEADAGVVPVLEIGFDATGCNTDQPLFSNDTAQLMITMSDSDANPPSVCVTQATSTVRLTAGLTGDVNSQMVAFTADQL